MGDCDGDYYLDWSRLPSMDLAPLAHRAFQSSRSTYESVCLKAVDEGYYLRLDGSTLKAQSHCQSQEQWWFLTKVSSIPQETGLYAIEHNDSKKYLARDGSTKLKLEASPNGESDYWWIDYFAYVGKFTLKNLNGMQYLKFSSAGYVWTSTLDSGCYFYLPDTTYIVNSYTAYLGHDGSSSNVFQTSAGIDSTSLKWNFYKVNS